MRPDSYAATMAADESWTLLGGVDADRESARAFGDRHSCAWSVDLTALLGSGRPDVVVVATPDSSHFATAHAVLSDAACPDVLVIEKPVCRSREEVSELSRLSAQQSCLVVVNHSRRFDKRYQRLRSAIRANRFGPLIKARSLYYGGWRHNGIHVVDTLAFLFDGAPFWTGSLGSVASRFPDDPTFHLSGSFPGIAGVVEVEGVDESVYQLFECDLRFEGGRVRINDFDSSMNVREVVVNALGERVLEETGFVLGSAAQTNTAVLLEAVSGYVRHGSDLRLADVGLEAAALSMRSLWQGGAIGERN
jgi:predicted dehydrogenase